MVFGLMFVSSLLLVSLPAAADMFAPSHSCSKPYKPFSFDDEWQASAFKSEVDTYKMCIEDFVEEQEEAVRQHQEAADEAIEEWNNYVRFEMN